MKEKHSKIETAAGRQDDEALSNEALRSRTPGFVWEMKTATANAANPTPVVSAAEGTLCE